MTMSPTKSLPARVRFLRRTFALLALSGALVLLMGCQPLIEVVQPASPLGSPLMPPPTVAPDERGLAILGVEFDPPLEAGQILSRGGVTLLVALENRGLVAETSAHVTARLSDPDAIRPSDLARETITVRNLEPGELRVVRFAQVTDLPLRSRYTLTVEVLPVSGERDMDDNSRTYDIVVRSGD
jgi:hypothetical protein